MRVEDHLIAGHLLRAVAYPAGLINWDVTLMVTLIVPFLVLVLRKKDASTSSNLPIRS